MLTIELFAYFAYQVISQCFGPAALSREGAGDGEKARLLTMT